MAQKNINTSLPRSTNTVVEFDFCCTQEPERTVPSGAKTRGFCGTSKYQGVYYRASRNKYRSRIRFARKEYSLGDFNNEKDAAKAYDKAAIELRGQTTSTNQKAFPKDFK